MSKNELINFFSTLDDNCTSYSNARSNSMTVANIANMICRSTNSISSKLDYAYNMMHDTMPILRKRSIADISSAEDLNDLFLENSTSSYKKPCLNYSTNITIESHEEENHNSIVNHFNFIPC